MKRLSLLVALAASLSASPAGASDFSALAKPEFARAMLLSEQRKEEIRCTFSWVMSKQRSKLAPLTAEIDRRAAIELGSREEFDRRDRDAEDYPDMAAAAAAERLNDPRRCGELEAGFLKSGKAAFALLAPESPGPIPLPSTGHCLAQIEKGPVGRDDPSAAKDLRQLRAQALASRNFSPEELAEIDRDYAAHQVKPANPPQPDPGMEIGIDDLICFPVMAEFARRAGPLPGPTER